MVLDTLTGLLGSTGYGALVGALSTYLGWTDDPNTPFEIRKFIKGLVTGALGGIATIALAWDSLEAALAGDPSGVAFIRLLIISGLAILGIDYGTSKISGIISNRTSSPVPSPTTA